MLLEGFEDRSPTKSRSLALKGSVDLAYAARQRFRSSSYRGLRALKCNFHDGVLTLRGRVNSYFLKQLAQELVRDFRGVEEIANRIEVVEGIGRGSVAWALDCRHSSLLDRPTQQRGCA